MVAEENEGEQLDIVLSLSSAKDSEDEFVGLRGGFKKKASMDGSGGNLHHSSGGLDRTKIACHDNKGDDKRRDFPLRKKTKKFGRTKWVGTSWGRKARGSAGFAAGEPPCGE